MTLQRSHYNMSWALGVLLSFFSLPYSVRLLSSTRHYFLKLKAKENDIRGDKWYSILFQKKCVSKRNLLKQMSETTSIELGYFRYYHFLEWEDLFVRAFEMSCLMHNELCVVSVEHVYLNGWNFYKIVFSWLTIIFNPHPQLDLRKSDQNNEYRT